MSKIYYFSVVLVLIAAVGLSNTAVAQQWSKEQQEVWGTVEAYWDVASKNNVEGFLGYFHDSFVGWNYGADAPQNKEDRSKMIRWGMKNSQNVFYTITPATIWVKDNFAFVNYYYTQVEKDAEGEEKWQSGRWTDILYKDGNKWVMVGDHGGQTSKDN